MVSPHDEPHRLTETPPLLGTLTRDFVVVLAFFDSDLRYGAIRWSFPRSRWLGNLPYVALFLALE
jgi:hypothetical protein